MVREKGHHKKVVVGKGGGEGGVLEIFTNWLCTRFIHYLQNNLWARTENLNRLIKSVLARTRRVG